MTYKENTVYHIYNQGNNRRKIFYCDRHYRYFLEKMQCHLLPHGDLISYCLMPNHFHWQFYVRRLEAPFAKHALRMGKPTHPQPIGRGKIVYRSLNDSLGIMLRSYTRAINKEMGWSGSLFRKRTKAKTTWDEEEEAQIGKPHTRPPMPNTYLETCFNYIHLNPVEAGLVTQAQDWKYSSYRDYFYQKKDSLCQLELGRQWIPEVNNDTAESKLTPAEFRER